MEDFIIRHKKMKDMLTANSGQDFVTDGGFYVDEDGD